LSELLVLKARVPRFGVLTVAAFDALREQPEVARLLAAAQADDLDDEARRVGHGEALVRALLHGPLDARVTAALHELAAAFPDDDRLAVRASPLGAPHERAVLAG